MPAVDGASVAVRLLINALVRDSNDAILVPIPQYPLYSASIQLYGGTLLPYNLKEQTGWSMDFNEIVRDVHAARCVPGTLRKAPPAASAPLHPPLLRGLIACWFCWELSDWGPAGCSKNACWVGRAPSNARLRC